MRAAAVLSLALLTTCALEAGPAPLPTDQVVARFPPGGVVDAIEIDAVNRLPLRTAELVSPDGATTSASYLHVSSSPDISLQQRLIDRSYVGNTSGLGVLGAGGPVPGTITGAPESNFRLLAMVSTASIPLPDEIAYRRDWRGYRIFLSFGDLAGEAERRILPAPEPPPNR